MSDERSSPPVAVAAAPGRSPAEREQALAPYLAQLGAGPDGPAAGRGVPASLTVGQATLELAPWERSVLEQYGLGADDSGRAWPSLVAEGVAFRAKCLLREKQLEAEEGSASVEHDARLLDELVAEAATGVALLAELQRNIDRVIREGEPKLAKPLTDFRNGIGKGVATMRNLMGVEAFAQASHRSAELARREDQTAADEPDEDTPARRKAPQQFKKDQAPTQMVFRRTVKKSRRVWILVGSLAASVLAWTLLTLSRTEYVAPPVLGIDQFRHIEAVRAVSARPPSLFVRVDGARWSRMSEADRRETLAQIGRTADQNGYIGVHAETFDGITVGKWFRNGEVRLVDARSGGS